MEKISLETLINHTLEQNIEERKNISKLTSLLMEKIYIHKLNETINNETLLIFESRNSFENFHAILYNHVFENKQISESIHSIIENIIKEIEKNSSKLNLDLIEDKINLLKDDINRSEDRIKTYIVRKNSSNNETLKEDLQQEGNIIELLMNINRKLDNHIDNFEEKVAEIIGSSFALLLPNIIDNKFNKLLIDKKKEVEKNKSKSQKIIQQQYSTPKKQSFDLVREYAPEPVTSFSLRGKPGVNNSIYF